MTISEKHRLDAGESDEVRALLHAAIDEDGAYPLSEHVFLHLTHGGETGDTNLLLRSGDGIVAYAHLDVTDPVEGASAELVVHPEHRGRGHATALVERLVELSPDGRLRLWAHGNLPAAAALAERLGFVKSRVLWQMRRSLHAHLPAPDLPPGIAVRPFEPGRDEQRWVEVNNRAFATHPDQGRWTVDDLKLREAESWFDPEGFFLAERGGELVAFHWTKVHGAEQGHAHAAIGEVYVVGVDPSAQGTGLGPAMTLVGLRHLRGLGLSQVMLFVDEENTNAVRVYERLGFTRWDTDVCYRRQPAP